MSKRSNKGISTSIIIGVILVLAFLVGGFAIWQHFKTQNEDVGKEELTSEENPNGEIIDSHLYRNRKYGFEVEIPEDFTITIKDASYFCQTNPEYECLFYIQFRPPSYIEQSQIRLAVFSNSKRSDAIGWLNEYQPEEPEGPQATSTSEEFIVDGEKGVEMVSVNDVNTYIVYFAKDKNMFSLRTSIETGQEGMIDVFHQMLSTFRFLD